MATTTNLSTLKINYLTKAQYDALVQAGEVNPDEIYLTPENGSVTETDPIFTASPAYGITDYNISNWDSKPSLIDVLETVKKAFILNVNGTTAMLIDYSVGSATSFLSFFNYYTIVQDCYIAQVINGATDINQAQVRVYEATEIDISTATVRLVSVDNGVIYTAELQDVGNGLVGTFSSQTIPTGGITTETDPTVPAWAKASTKPTYTASEVGALASTGGQITGDLTLYVASGNSPGLIFQRGTLTDNYNDWKIYDKGGYLYFAQRGSGFSSFNDMGYIDTTGVLRSFTIPWGSVTGKPTFATVATSGSYNDLTDTPTIPTMGDYVVETGTEGIWTFRKWNSGIAECWGTGTCSVTSWKTWGQMYYGDPYTNYTYPSGLFKSGTHPVLTASGGTTIVKSSADIFSAGFAGNSAGIGSNTHTPKIFLTRPSSGSTGDYAIFMEAKGVWK